MRRYPSSIVLTEELSSSLLQQDVTRGSVTMADKSEKEVGESCPVRSSAPPRKRSRVRRGDVKPGRGWMASDLQTKCTELLVHWEREEEDSLLLEARSS